MMGGGGGDGIAIVIPVRLAKQKWKWALYHSKKINTNIFITKTMSNANYFAEYKMQISWIVFCFRSLSSFGMCDDLNAFHNKSIIITSSPNCDDGMKNEQRKI